MFDLISGGPRHPFHDRTAAPVIVSVVGHVVMITLVFILPLADAMGTVPSVPTMMAFVAAAPAPPPLPPPPPPARSPSAVKTPPSHTEPTTSGAFAAPEAPSEIRSETPRDITYGGEGGIEGGVEGGAAGGIVDGLTTAPPPPPPPPPSPPPAPKGPIRIGGLVQAPALVKRVEPLYPDVAL